MMKQSELFKIISPWKKQTLSFWKNDNFYPEPGMIVLVTGCPHFGLQADVLAVDEKAETVTIQIRKYPECPWIHTDIHTISLYDVGKLYTPIKTLKPDRDTMKKNIYICDPMGDADFETKELEIATGLEITHIENPNFEEMHFDVLFFDWGGMILGNSFMESFCRRILKHAEHHPSRFYVMASRFTRLAMIDAVLEFGNDKPANILLSIDELKPHIEIRKQ